MPERTQFCPMATYDYEQVAPDRFQQLCQALLTGEFPNLQRFPVGQADGGRDGVVREYTPKSSKPSLVYQVKFSTKAGSSPDPEKWLHKIVTDELPNIQTLAQQGA